MDEDKSFKQKQKEIHTCKGNKKKTGNKNKTNNEHNQLIELVRKETTPKHEKNGCDTSIGSVKNQFESDFLPQETVLMSDKIIVLEVDYNKQKIIVICSLVVFFFT